MMPKRTGYNISAILVRFACVKEKTKTGTADVIKCASIFYYFAGLVACDISRRDKYWIKPKMSECKNFLEKYEPRHDKTNKVTVRPAKTQISLGIRPVRSESLLCA